MENLDKDTGWKAFSGKVVLEPSQFGTEIIIIKSPGLTWNAIMAMQKKKKRYV